MRWGCSGDCRPSGFRAEALKAASPNTFLLDILGWWRWKVPTKDPSSHQGKGGQCLSTGASLGRDLPELTLPGLLRAWGCRASLQALGCQAAWCPHGPCDRDHSRRLLARRPSLVTCLEPGDLFFSEISLSRCCLPVSAWRPSALSALFLLQRLWLFLWPSLTAHSQPTPWSLCPWQLRTKLPLEQTPAPGADVALRRGSPSAFHVAEQVSTALSPEWEAGVRKPLVPASGWSPSLTCHPLLGPPKLLLPLVWGASHMRFPLPGRLLTSTLHHSSSGPVWCHPLGSPHRCVPNPGLNHVGAFSSFSFGHAAPLHHLHESWRAPLHSTVQTPLQELTQLILPHNPETCSVFKIF